MDICLLILRLFNVFSNLLHVLDVSCLAGTGGPYLEIFWGDFQRILDRLPGAGVFWLFNLGYALYLLHKASYSQFCVKIRDFSLLWQQGRSRQICLTPLNVPTLNTP